MRSRHGRRGDGRRCSLGGGGVLSHDPHSMAIVMEVMGVGGQ